MKESDGHQVASESPGDDVPPVESSTTSSPEQESPPEPLSRYERFHRLLRRDFLVGGVSPRYFITRWIFLRFLGIIHVIAFLSIWVQLSGLIGSRGIAPVNLFLELVQSRTGIDRYWKLPTLCWLNSSDWFLHAICGSGLFFAVVLVLGYAPPLCLAMLYVLYLSLVSVAPDFLAFQWDTLLLEATFLAIFFAPMQWRPNIAREQVHSRVMLLLLRWLLFRLMFMSGVVKLDDVTWRNLTALNFHYETQPLPTVIGWYFHQLPEWFHRVSVASALTIELLVPFLVLAPRRLRGISAVFLIAFQVIIMATGNFTFFNLLAIALCLLLIDDRHWRGVLPKRAVAWLNPPETIRPLPFYRKAFMGGIAVLIALITGSHMAQLLPNSSGPPALLFPLVQRAYPYYIANRYGLFAHMTTNRPEIIVEGRGPDGEWNAYEFKYKPDNLDEAPHRVAPHQPRLDWQMWFATFRPRPPAWFLNFCYRLLQGEPDVLALLDENPFPDEPPIEVRALRYEYRMTDIATKRETGNWWSRELVGEFIPPMRLEQQSDPEPPG
ncbi:MAG: membrane protein [Candidatus Hydrogenedentota bacterium]